MQKLFDEVVSLDKRCYEEFFLSEDILMEHAADGMASYIRQNFKKNSKIIIVCGSGNNGADGATLARLLYKSYSVSIFWAKNPTSKIALLQQRRSLSIGINECTALSECDILVDAIVGTGFRADLSDEISALISEMNALNAFKIACDIPSAFSFRADVTLTMGALKKSLYLDEHKEFVGKIEVLDLGIDREIYEKSSSWMVLDLDDLKLPNRVKKDSHKGTYGHLAVASGEKSGASIIAALCAFRFGSGLVTLVGFEKIEIPYTLMYSHEVPAKATALALGMGLGVEFSKIELDKFLDNSLPLLCDADLFYMPIIEKILGRKDVVITPHPKEFVSLLKILNITDITVFELQKERFKYVEIFCKKFPHITLLLKGANVIIAQNGSFFINPHGTELLAKGGSGDVLSGLIASLLAQGYSTLDAAISGSLAHTKLALNYDGADFSLTPKDMIDGISKL